MSNVYADLHTYEADVTPCGYGSRLRVDGHEVPQVRSFEIKADVESASLTIEVLSLAKVVGEVKTITIVSDVYVVQNDDDLPMRVFTDREAAQRFKEEHGAEDWWVVGPIKIEVAV